MGIGIRCILKPEAPSAAALWTDGKNLAQAYMAALLGGHDLDALLGELEERASDMEPLSPEMPGIFAAIEPFISQDPDPLADHDELFHSPAAGQEAIEKTLTLLRSPSGEAAVPDEDLRSGCIHDLETFGRQLREAERHGARFTLAWNL